jgi:hypothetical protein
MHPRRSFDGLPLFGSNGGVSVSFSAALPVIFGTQTYADH